MHVSIGVVLLGHSIYRMPIGYAFRGLIPTRSTYLDMDIRMSSELMSAAVQCW